MKTDKPTPNKTVYISNLSYERDRNGLRSLFAKFGEILNIKIVVEPETNQSRGMAFIEMATAAQAKKAIEELHQKVIDGRTVKVKYATPLRETSKSAKPEKKELKKDLSYKATQLAKKARNDAKRKSNPFDFKKKVAKKATKKA